MGSVAPRSEAVDSTGTDTSWPPSDLGRRPATLCHKSQISYPFTTNIGDNS